MSSKALFTIGKITGVHGLNGNLKVWSFAESIDTFSTGRIVLLQIEDGHTKEYSIQKAQPHKKGILLLLEGIADRNAAENVVGYDILIHRDQLPEPEDDSWYWQDLIGLKVTDEVQGDLGHVADIFPTGANDVLVVTDDDNEKTKREILIPMHENFVLDVDLDNGIMIVTLPEDYQ